MTHHTNPTACMAHLVIQDMKPCTKNSVAADPLSHKPFLLCDFHMWKIALHSKRKAREEVTTKVTVVETDQSEHLKQIITRLESTIRDLRSEISDLRRPDNATTTRKNEPIPQDGTIYFLRVGSYIKIGWTGDLTKRMKGYPPDSLLLATMPGTRSDELREHQRFAHLRTHGREWYPIAPQITERVAVLVREHGEPGVVDFAARQAQVRVSRAKSFIRPRSYR